MRRENRRNLGKEGLETKKVLYISGSILAIAIIGFVITFFIYGNKLEQDTTLGKLNTNIMESYGENTEAASLEFGKTVNEMENEITNDIADNTKYAINTSNIEGNMLKESTATENTTANATKNNTTANSKNTITNNQSNTTKTNETKDPTFQKPVTGEIVKEFAKDKLVYSNTLGEWITHMGIDIKADKTTVVKASAEGTIKSIKNDPRYGLTVVIEHSNGFTSVYSNLLTAEFVVEGEKVKQGQTIGTVGTTATFEISDEAHLHFEIKKDGENLDPELYIKD